MLYYLTGKKDAKNCAKVPKVCELLDQIPPAKTCVRGQVRSELLQKKKSRALLIITSNGFFHIKV